MAAQQPSQNSAQAQPSNRWNSPAPAVVNHQPPPHLAAWAQAQGQQPWSLALTAVGVRRYSEGQRYELEEIYESVRYPSWEECQQIATALGTGGKDGKPITKENVDVSKQLIQI